MLIPAVIVVFCMTTQPVAAISGSGIGASQSFGYDFNGNLRSETDWKGQATEHGYDGLNRRTQTTDRDGKLFATHYLDPIGLNRDEIDARGFVAALRYDRLDRLTTTTQALGTPEQRVTTVLTFDGEGHPLDQTDGLGRHTVMAYDGEFRPLSVTQAAGTSSERPTQFAYDAVGNQTMATDAGSLRYFCA